MVLFLLSASFGLPLAQANSQTSAKQGNSTTSPLPQSAFAPLGSKAFAFVSNFESKTLEGWQGIQGQTPSVVTSPNYSGEPALSSSASKVSQIDFANKGFVLGQSSLSFQVAMHVPSGSSGYIGLGSSKTNFVALVGVKNGAVVAGATLSGLKTVEKVPSGTAYPKGWVYIIADLSNSGGKWSMQVFVDETETILLQVSTPKAGSYIGGIIETTSGTVYYTNVIFSTFQIANYDPGYHPMQGYGGRVASAGIVRLLPAYKNLTAVMTIDTFSVPESDVLSFQINAQNYTAATQNTCVGFFQIGLFLDSSSGYVDPWYVPYGDCIPYSFPQGGTLQIPEHTKIVLSIVFEKNQILFREDYLSINKVLYQSIPCNCGPFYSAYTQMEFQPSSNYPIQDYALKGSIFGIQITLSKGGTEYLPAIYMMPFNLDAPTTWDVHYYVNATAGYHELTT